jgi:hypothetical protein
MHTRVFALAVILSACGKEGKVPTPPLDEGAEVRNYGEIRKIFAGDWTASATLASKISGDSYAVGALSDLRGEFAVIGGDVWLSYPAPEPLPQVQHVPRSEEEAALLVVAEVRSWKASTLDEDVASAGLDSVLIGIAQAAGIESSVPFPFTIEGTLRNVGWHVADGTRVKPGDPPDKDAQHGEVLEAPGTIVGFYSTKHQGVFTMMGQNTHMHVVLSDDSVVGHVRAVDIAAGAVVSVPAPQ